MNPKMLKLLKKFKACEYAITQAKKLNIDSFYTLAVLTLKHNKPRYFKFIIVNHKKLEMTEQELFKLQKLGLKLKNEVFCYVFARYVDFADIKRLQKVVVNSKNLAICNDFSLLVKGADVKELREVLTKATAEKLIIK